MTPRLRENLRWWERCGDPPRNKADGRKVWGGGRQERVENLVSNTGSERTQGFSRGDAC